MIKINRTKYIKFFIFLLFIFFTGFLLRNITWAEIPGVDLDIGAGGTNDVDANDIEAISNSNVWLVANSSKVYNMDGTAWVDHTPTLGARWAGNHIYDVSASEASKVWISGAGGHVWMNNGSGTGGWTQHFGSSRWETSAIFGISALNVGGVNPNRVWIVGANGNVWKYNGTTWYQETNTGRWGSIQLESVSLLSENEAWIAGAAGNVWECNETGTWGTDSCDDVDDDWINHTPAGGTRWCDDDPCSSNDDVLSISAYSATDVWLTAEGGHVWKWNGSSWTQFSDTDRWGTSNIFDVSNRYSTEPWIVGASGKVWEYNLPRWEVAETPVSTETCFADSSTCDDVVINGITYNRNFYMQNVCRATTVPYAITGITDDNGTDGPGSATTCTGSTGAHDPSTLKVTVLVSWTGGETISRSEYITRWQGGGCLQTTWSTSGSTGAKICSFSGTTTEYDNINPAGTISTGGTLSLTPPAASDGTLTSAVFDTTEVGTSGRGAAFNSVSWQGTRPADSSIRFQIAASDDPDGPWTYTSGLSNCGTGEAGLGQPGDATRISCPDIQNKRYFKYKLKLCNDSNCGVQAASAGPTVTDFIINWSP